MVKTLFQASTWNALEAGSFDGAVSVRELLCCADTGVGIGTALDGVITFENGAAYKTAPDGKVTVMRPEDGVAFAAAMVFDENAPEIALNGIDDLTSLKQMFTPFVQGNPNLFYMIKAGGVFKSVHTQSWNSCRKPYCNSFFASIIFPPQNSSPAFSPAETLSLPAGCRSSAFPAMPYSQPGRICGHGRPVHPKWR